MYIRERVLGGDVAALDGWLRQYVADHAFRCVTAADMVAHLRAHFAPRPGAPLDAATGALPTPLLKEWLEGEGMPPAGYAPDQSAAVVLTTPAEEMQAAAIAAPGAALGGTLEALCAAFRTWPTYQQSYMLDRCIGGVAFAGGAAALLAVGAKCGLHAPPSSNCELSMRWSVLLCKEGATAALGDVEAHLLSTGKQKFLLPVYRALAKAQPRCVFDELAARTFARARESLDGLVARKVEEILAAPIVDDPPVPSERPGAGWANLRRGKCWGCPKC